ncbi:MAG: hypothetical protein DCE92_01850 [Alphaproteobacteria bacterium]|nr:MAG: hypothetical protein DCE92_01850 [Alphaproteobacteria bacterium]
MQHEVEFYLVTASRIGKSFVMPAKKADSIGRDGVVMIDGDADDIAAGRVVPKINADRLQQLATGLGVSSANQQLELETAVNRYYRDMAQQLPHPPTKGEMNASIKIIEKIVKKARNDPLGKWRRELDVLLNYTDGNLAWCLRCEISRQLPALETVHFEEIPLDVVAGALADCRTTSRGPLPPDRPMIGLIASLTSLYESVADKVATHNPKIKTEYNGTPQSEAGRFVLKAVKAIDPGILPMTINSLFGQHLKSRRLDSLKPQSANAK